MISQHLPFVMGEVFGRPHYLSLNHANMIVAALSGRLDIRSLATEGQELDARGMEDLAGMGRMEARARVKTTAHPGISRELVGYDGLPYELSSTGIAILPVFGTLRRRWGVGPYSGATGYDGLWAQLTHAIENPDVKAIWWSHASGGGAVDGLPDLADFVYANSARFGGKPMWGYAADHALSASYFLLAACDHVVMPELGMVGSIGTVIMHAEASEALAKEGVKVTVFRSPDGKARGNSMEPMDEGTAAQYQAMVEEANDVFVGRVTLYRKLSKKTVSGTNAAVYSGAQALTTGLVNEVLSEPEAWAKLERKIARS